jgi:sensor histidine kinase regulating citrate/malate metabolism
MLEYIIIFISVCAAIAGAVLFTRRYISITLDKKILAFQNDLITKHCDEVQNIYMKMRGWRHDYHNHIQSLKAYRTLGQNTEIDDYLNKLDEDLTSVDTVFKTGNIMIDAILNSKISLAADRKINVTATAIVPKALPVSEIDLCVIIGNLLDNAMEASLKLNEADRIVRVYIDKFNEYLYISVTNAMSGYINKSAGYISSKGENHGFGLISIDKIAKKYGGHINRQNEDGVFATEVMLPIK